MKPAPLDVNPFYEQMTSSARGILKVALRIFPAHAYVVLRSEWRMAQLRLKTRATPETYEDARDLLLNLGAGSRGKPGWVNVDAFPNANITCVYDCRKRLPFPDSSARGIFSEHFVEHLDYTDEVPEFLAECQRVLQPGGVIRIVVPDAERYMRAYCEPGWDALEQLRLLKDGRVDPFLGGRYRTKMELLNVIFRQGHEHKYAWDFDTMAMVLERHGFAEITRASFGSSRSRELAIDEADRKVESLYVEATRS